MRKAMTILLIGVLFTASVAVLIAYRSVPTELDSTPETFVGVTYCGDSIEDAKLLIDRVKDYTNLFVLQSGVLQRSFESVTEIGDYAISCGLFFLPYFGSYISHSFSSWIETAQQRWGDHFVGVYYDDEPGGKMLDDYVEFKDADTGNNIIKTRYGDVVVEAPSGVVVHYEINGIIHLYEPSNLAENSYFTNLASNQSRVTDIYATFYPNGTYIISKFNSILPDNHASNWSSLISYEELLINHPFKTTDEVVDRFYSRNHENIQFMANRTKVFTSDYAMYWFDYKAGYDVILAQIGWNNSFPQNIALIRGAANLQNKEWGAILTWKYNTPPYLDTGTELLRQMQTAYECGAKYIILFNYYENTGTPYGTLQDEHFIALETFWNNLDKNIHHSITANSVLILPENYGCGFRWKEDRVWGVLKPSEDSYKIWNILQVALKDNSFHLDIVYESPEYIVTNKYLHVIYWNQIG
jgi:hypothetical protein